MGKGVCKFCKEEIDYLNCERKVVVGSTYELIRYEGQELSEYNDQEVFGETEEDLKFLCPSCDRKVATTEKEAFSILRQIDELDETIIEKLKNIKNENKKHTI